MTVSRVLCSPESAQGLIAAARDTAPVAGLTHNLYKYPARFSPSLARKAIEVFTQPGDLVLDPFVGGGTTLVEALALGRHAIGSDISTLATFVSTVKTTLYTQRELRRIVDWSVHLPAVVNVKRRAPVLTTSESQVRNLGGAATWRLKKAIAQAIGHCELLESSRVQALARCIVLRTAQWALDGRKHIPSVDEFRTALVRFAHESIFAAEELSATARVPGNTPYVRCLNCATDLLPGQPAIARRKQKPKLVITSPPYPGVHVLYHRWQVDGRKETPAPFWIANQLDGDGAAYYTMGARNNPGLRTYFDNLATSLKAVADICDSRTTVVQVVAFSEPEWQLPRYLSVADDVGLEETTLRVDTGSVDGRLWREVPNRRWYAEQQGSTSGSKEVVLFHKVKSRRH